MNNKIIIALDVNSFEKAKELVDALSPNIDIFKVGSELFTSTGPEIIDYINKRQKKVFLDLKFFDIPTTVKKAVLAAAKHNVFMLTLHVTGGADMLKEASGAVKGKGKRPLLVGVTLLTSKADKNSAEEVTRLARIAQDAGLDGIVCSARETKEIKNIFGEKLLVINPGIRPSWAQKDLSSEAHLLRDSTLAKEDDQKRVATPSEAIKSGADFIVIGRPITQAEDPASAAKKILKELA
jgi:orotidine-5'-phosphate decarboxylase